MNTVSKSIQNGVALQPGLHCIKFMDTRQVHEYPDTTVLTVLKWRIILNKETAGKTEGIEPLFFK